MLLIVQQDVFLHCCCQKFGVFCLGFTSLHLHVIYFPSWSWNLFITHLSWLLCAEAEGEEFGQLEEHPWTSSLGGLQAVPGPAAKQGEQRVRSWKSSPLEACHRLKRVGSAVISLLSWSREGWVALEVAYHFCRSSLKPAAAAGSSVTVGRFNIKCPAGGAAAAVS